MTDRYGIRTNILLLGQLREDDDQLMVKCKITYPDVNEKNFVGGEVEATPLTLKIASISSFTVNDAVPIAGNSVTFTCIATAQSQPQFSLTTKGSPLKHGRFEITEEPDIEQNVYDFTKKYVITTKLAYVSGQTLTCTVCKTLFIQ